MPIKRLNTADNAQGGYFVLEEFYKEVNRMLRDGGCVEACAKHFPMSSLTLDVPKFLTGVDGYWVDAMAVKEKDKPTFEVKTITAEKMAVIENTVRCNGDIASVGGYMLETPSIPNYSTATQAVSENVTGADNQQGSFTRQGDNPSETTRRPLGYFPYSKMMI